jgi:hypothetical protein
LTSSLFWHFAVDYSSSEGEGSCAEEATATMALRQAAASSGLDPLSTGGASDLAMEVFSLLALYLTLAFSIIMGCRS